MAYNDASPVERKQIVNYYENKIQALKKILDHSEELNSTLLQENDALQKEISASKRKAQGLFKTAEKLKVQEQTASKINDILLEQKSAVQEDRANIKRENSQLRSKIKTLQEQLAAQEASLLRFAALEKTLKGTASDLAEKEAEIEDLEKLVMELGKKNVELQIKLEEMKREKEMELEMKLIARTEEDLKTSIKEKSYEEEEPLIIESVEEEVSIKTEFESCTNFIWVTEISTQTEASLCSVTTQTMTAIDFREDFQIAPVHVTTSCFQIMPVELREENETVSITQTSSIVVNTTCARALPCNDRTKSVLSPSHCISPVGSSLFVYPEANGQLVPVGRSYKTEAHFEVFSTKDMAVQTSYEEQEPLDIESVEEVVSIKTEFECCDLPHQSPLQSLRPGLTKWITYNSSPQKTYFSMASLTLTSEIESYNTRSLALQGMLFRLFPVFLAAFFLPASLLTLYVGYHSAAEFLVPGSDNCFSHYELISTIIKENIQRRMYLYYPYGPPPT